MNIRQRLSGLWLISMSLLSLFAFTVYYVAQIWLSLLQNFYLTLTVLQIITLILYLWGSEKLKSRVMKIIYRGLYLTSLLVIPSFMFIFMGLISQYHARIPDSIDASGMPQEQILPAERTVVYNTGLVYVIFPEYSVIEHVSEHRPSKSDKSITWCSSAAFQHDIRFDFSHDNIDGDHADNGTLYLSPTNLDSFDAFVFANGKYGFEFDHPVEAMKEAAEAGGNGFMQFGLIRDGEDVMTIRRPRARCYRTLAELNGHICLIDSINMLAFEDFLAELHRLGVTNALYMDMGAGWNYSWFRDALDRVITLFALPVPWSHNWVIFRK